MTNDKQEDSKSRKPRDKSISLKPLNFKEALANLLAVKPKKKNKKADNDTKKPSSE